MTVRNEVPMDAVQVAALWLHTLAMVIVVGYYGILGRIVLPALSRGLDGEALARIVPAIERRAVPFVVVSVVAFVATGSYLLAVDTRYEGLGAFFASTWSTLMLVKHGVIVLMVGLAVGVDRLAAMVGEATDEARGRTMGYLGLATEAMTALGALVLLLTAAAQLS
jgi:uncharacterized membrane protein